MKLSSLFVANAIFALIGSLILLVAPEQTMTSYGTSLNAGGLFVAHILGVTVLGIAVISFLARSTTDRLALQAILPGFIIAHAGSAVIAFMATTSGLFNQMGWSDVVIHSLFALGFVYYWRR